nr:hypothetical protein L203_00449 [Cryptococcus depauperatus CBS 7841]
MTLAIDRLASSCLGIQTNDDADWFTTVLCALTSINFNKVRDNIKLDKGGVDNAESATFSVYGLDSKDGKAKQVPVHYKDAAGPDHDNAGNHWYAGGFWKAIVSTGGSGVVKDGLFNSTANSDDKKWTEAGLWGFKYLTGMDAERIDITDANKDWGIVDNLMDKANHNPITILTKGEPSISLRPNHYYTVYSKHVDEIHIVIWNSTNPSHLQDSFITVTSKELRDSAKALYHLKDWAKF